MKLLRKLLTHIKSGIMLFILGFNDTYTLNPPADVPLTDIPGKLLNTRTKIYNTGKIEVVEAKLNLTEYERIKPIINKWFSKP